MTNVAGVQEFASVRTLVIVERARLQESLAAFVALERSFAGVRSHVSVQPRRRSKPLITGRARICLLAGMYHANVPLQVAQPRKLLAAFFADERPLAGVPAHVVLQRTHAREPFLADAARIRRHGLVRAQMDVKAAGVSECLLANVARKRTLFGV